MIEFDLVRQLVPFVGTVGVDSAEVSIMEDRSVALVLRRHDRILNHLSTFHAGALFTLGATTGGYAIIAALGPEFLAGHTLVAANATIEYTRLVRSEAVCRGRLSDDDAHAIRSMAVGEVHKFEIVLGFEGDGRPSGTMTCCYSVKRKV